METKKPSLLLALTPILLLVVSLFVNVKLFGEDSSYGPNQISLIVAAGIASIIGLRLGFKWNKIKEGMTKSISSTLGAIIILLLIGALAGTWVISGIVPAMVYYGLQVLNPESFLFACCVVCAVVSLATGSSWSTIATVGIALLGIGQAMDMHTGLTAGAIISGAYFGDKMSPLSDTTNLAPAMAGTDLFTHIRHMAWTTIPSIVITLIIFLIIGFNTDVSTSSSGMEEINKAITQKFHITPLLFLVPAVVIFMIIRKIPAIPSLLVGALLGGVFALIFQQDVVEEVGSKTTVSIEGKSINSNDIVWKDASGEVISDFNTDDVKPGKYIIEYENKDEGTVAHATFTVKGYGKDANMSQEILVERNGQPMKSEANVVIERSDYITSAYTAFMVSLTTKMKDGYAIHSDNEAVSELVEGKGMSGMLNTIWLIVCAMAFGGAMETIGLLQRITETIIGWARSRGGLIGATASTCIFFNATASDQYLAIVVPGRMFANTYRKRGLKPENLSRTLEDAGTVTSVLIPWNTCGATQSQVLGIGTLTFAPFCFFNIISPIITIIYGIVGFKVPMIEKPETTEPAKLKA